MNRIKKYVLILLLLAALAAIGIFASCIPQNSNNPATVSLATSSHGSVFSTLSSSSASGTAAASTEARSALLKFRVTLNGVVYTLPEDFSKFSENGWIGTDLDKNKLMPKGKTLPYLLKNNECSIMVSFFNITSDYLELSKCKVGGILFEDGALQSGTVLTLPNDITLGSSYDAVLSAYGDPDIHNEIELYHFLVYGTTNQQVKFEIIKGAKTVTSIEISNISSSGTTVPAADSTASSSSAVQE